MVVVKRLPDGVELAVHDPARATVVARLVDVLPDVRAAALSLLQLQLRPEFRAEMFWLDSVEVYGERSAEGEDAVLAFSYCDSDDPHGEADTRFDVFVRVGLEPREEPFRPVRLAVGFR